MCRNVVAVRAYHRAYPPVRGAISCSLARPFSGSQTVPNCAANLQQDGENNCECVIQQWLPIEPFGRLLEVAYAGTLLVVRPQFICSSWVVRANFNRALFSLILGPFCQTIDCYLQTGLDFEVRLLKLATSFGKFAFFTEGIASDICIFSVIYSETLSLSLSHSIGSISPTVKEACNMAPCLFSNFSADLKSSISFSKPINDSFRFLGNSCLPNSTQTGIRDVHLNCLHYVATYFGVHILKFHKVVDVDLTISTWYFQGSSK